MVSFVAVGFLFVTSFVSEVIMKTASKCSFAVIILFIYSKALH